MGTDNILVLQKNKIAQVTINRPNKLNALNKVVITELSGIIKSLEKDDNTRVIILTGAEDKAFVAGADISEFSGYDSKKGQELAAKGQHYLFDLIENLSKPVIAAINGYALGGGLELAMACHIRIASTNAKMGLPETSLGLLPGYGGTQRLPQLVGKGKAFEMILSASMIDAEQAQQNGLVNSVSSLEELIPTCENLAHQIIKNSPNAITQSIKAINSGYNNDLNGYQEEIRCFGECFGTPDFIEGTTAFLEKRKPQF